MKKVVLIELILLLLIVGCSSKEEEIKESVRPVFSAVVKTKTSSTANSFNGLVYAGNEAKLSFRVGGTVKKVSVNLGDKVRRGAVIASLDTKDIQLKLKQAETAYNAAKVQWQNSKNSYERVEKLFEKNAIALAEYEKAKGAFDAAKVSLRGAKLAMQAVRNSLAYTKLVAPSRGTITAIYANEGEMIGAGKPVAAIASDTVTKVRVSLPASVVQGVKTDQIVQINLTDLPGKSYEGEVTEVSYSAGKATTYPVIITLKKSDKKIRPGMSCTVRFDFEEAMSSILIVPTDAVGRDGEEHFLYVLSPSEKELFTAHRKVVTVGNVTSEGYEIIEGVSEGERVVTAGISQLYEGRIVRLVK